MKRKFAILFLFFCLVAGQMTGIGQKAANSGGFDFCGDRITCEWNQAVDFAGPLSDAAISEFYKELEKTDYQQVVKELLAYKQQHKPDDWLYYQLVRRTAQQFSPKADNYHRYTLYKWFLMAKSGYDVMLSVSGNLLLFYVQSDENIYNIPFRIKNGRQYVCLNYHDYKKIDFDKDRFTEVALEVPGARHGFSYKLTKLPDFTAEDYVEKDIRFNYCDNNYQFKVKINNQVQKLLTNYPVTDYGSYLNMPLSRETYNSLIPVLKKTVKGLSTKNGVDYLMRFTRYAFLFQPDSLSFGGEKRLTAEQTLFYDQSDCEDRAALFFCLVKEIYNLPMIVLNYPKHVTIAVQFEKPFGRSITYNGHQYSICEPSSQSMDLAIGEIAPALRKAPYEVAYSYIP